MTARFKPTSSLMALTLLKGGASALELFERLQGQPSARVLLSHYFLFDESRSQSIDRLRRELDFISRRFRPIGVPELLAHLAEGNIPDDALVYTTDDVHRDVFEVHEEF